MSAPLTPDQIRVKPDPHRRGRAVTWLKRRFYSNQQSSRFKYRQTLAEYAHQANRVLDIGCGYTAPDLEALSGIPTKVGVDIVGVFRKSEAKTVNLVQGDCRRLPFGDASFDLVVCRSVLEHVDRPPLVFDEVARVLAPRGHFVFLTPNRWDYVSMIATGTPNRLHPKLVQRFSGIYAEHTFPTYYRANSPRKIRKLVNRSGMRVEKLSMLREHPHYLQFNAVTYSFGLVYEQVVERFLSFLRPWILVECCRDSSVRVRSD